MKAGSRHFTLRQLKYKRNRLKGMTQYDAAIAAGYSAATASHACQGPERVVKSSLIDELNRSGLTDRELARQFALPALAPVTRYKGAEKLKALETVCRLKGLLSDAPVIDQSIHENFTIILPQEVHARPDVHADAEASVSVSLSDQS